MSLSRGVLALAPILTNPFGPDLADLNWRRLKYWRRVVGQALDPASAPGSAESVSEILIDHGPHTFLQAWELAAWLSRRLGWKVKSGRLQMRVEANWLFAGPKGETRVRIRRMEKAASEVLRVRLACNVGGKAGALDITLEGENRLAILLEGVDATARTITVPPRSPAELVGRQLSDRERDPVFREAMTVVQAMAQLALK